MSKQQKEAFKFQYTRPWLDWYEDIKVEIKPDDYYYFRIERRFDSTWWLIGMIPPTRGADDYKWKYEEIGQIYERDLIRFIEWAKTDHGSKIIEFKAISGDLDVLEAIAKLLRRAEDAV